MSDDDWMNMADSDEEIELEKEKEFKDEKDVEVIKPEL